MAADLVGELNNLDFSVYIGGPMQAAIAAQNSASMAEVDFIKKVGFKKDSSGTEELVYVNFEYLKKVPVTSTHPDGEARYKLSVPLLTIITIPALRIEEMTIDFNAKLNSCDTTSISSDIEVNVETGIKWGVVNFKASASYKKKTVVGSEVERSYELSVHVKVVNDEIPAGLERIIQIMENEIKDKPVSTSAN
ncbi:MAG: DUF2589 domain-containing protein [Bacteroidales bacterium]|jgi:hypothetical protein|nr:DUF2589 domain-containing protein [Bacteroidales bacterium]